MAIQDINRLQQPIEQVQQVERTNQAQEADRSAQARETEQSRSRRNAPDSSAISNEARVAEQSRSAIQSLETQRPVQSPSEADQTLQVSRSQVQQQVAVVALTQANQTPQQFLQLVAR
jgi:hypothetical protein